MLHRVQIRSTICVSIGHKNFHYCRHYRKLCVDQLANNTQTYIVILVARSDVRYTHIKYHTDQCTIHTTNSPSIVDTKLTPISYLVLYTISLVSHIKTYEENIHINSKITLRVRTRTLGKSKFKCSDNSIRAYRVFRCETGFGIPLPVTIRRHGQFANIYTFHRFQPTQDQNCSFSIFWGQFIVITFRN